MLRVVMLSGVLLASPLFAQDQAAPDCDSAQTTIEMGSCLQQGLQDADSALNATYGIAMDNLTGGGFDKGQALSLQLRAAQRAWITYRDLACDAEMALYEGGTMAGIAKTGCLLRLTQERITSLSEFLPN